MLSRQDKASHGHERCRSHQSTAHSYTTCDTGGSKVSPREHRPNIVLPTPYVSTIYRKVSLEPELFMVESKVQTAGYRFISRVLTLSCISECTDEIQNGRKGGRGKKIKPRRGPGRVLNVWKSVLPIPAIKSEQQQAQTHNSECGWLAERCQAGFQLNQYLTFNMAAEWHKNTYEKEISLFFLRSLRRHHKPRLDAGDSPVSTFIFRDSQPCKVDSFYPHSHLVTTYFYM